jgi:hypothetical protein
MMVCGWTKFKSLGLLMWSSNGAEQARTPPLDESSPNSL